MEILLFSQALHPAYGGSAFSEGSLAGALTKAGHQVTVLCRSGTFDVDFCARFGKLQVQGYSAFQWIGAWLQRGHPLRQKIRSADLVHINGHWRWENYFAARICVAEAKPYVLQPRGMLWLGHRKIFLKKIFNWLLGNFVVRRAARVVALSTFELRQWTRYHLSEDKMAVLPNGVVGGESVSDSGVASDLRFPDTGYFLYLGRLEARKNLVFLLEAYREYRRRGGIAELWLVGPSERGYDEVLRKAILHMGLVSKVRLQAPVFSQAKMEIMKSALGLVYPAIEEPFGRVPFEALDAGTFSIVPRKSGSAEYIGPFLPECIYGDDRKASLADVFFRLQQPDKSLIQRRQEAQQWVQSELRWDRVCSRYLDLYRNTTARATRDRESADAPLETSASRR